MTLSSLEPTLEFTHEKSSDHEGKRKIVKVLIVAEYLDDIQKPDSYNSRFFAIADRLVARGHTVCIVTTDFIHSAKRHVSGVTAYKTCELKTLHEPGYRKNVSLKRFYSHWMLAKNLKRWLQTIEKPDVIYCAIPSLDFAHQAAKYAKKNRIKFVLDIQDLWPEAFEMVFHIPVITKLVFAPLRSKANAIYRMADRIVAVSKTYESRAQRVRKRPCTASTVFLGTDLVRFDDGRKERPALEKKPGEIWLGYIGTLGHSYDLKSVINALDCMRDKSYYNQIRFVVMGDGPLRSVFEDYAAEKCVNVSFLGKLPYSQMVATLCACDIAVNPITKGAAQSIINKHGDYASAGIPIVSSQECSEYRLLVETWNMGINCACADPRDMADALSRLIEDETLRGEMGKNARRCAEECFDRQMTYPRIVETIES